MPADRFEVFDELPPRGGYRSNKSENVAALDIARLHRNKWVVLFEDPDAQTAGKHAQQLKLMTVGKRKNEFWDFASRTLPEDDGNTRYVVLGSVTVLGEEGDDAPAS